MTITEWHPLLSCARFLKELISIDFDLSKSCRESRCPHCGSALHAGFYERKIRLGEFVEDFNRSYSLCCCARDCRKRTQPPSVRFCGRSPFPFAAIAIAEIFAKGPSPKRVSAICKLLDVAERTVRRWLQCWRGISGTSWWRARSDCGYPEWPGSVFVRLALFYAKDRKETAASMCAILGELSSLKFLFSRHLAFG